MWKSIASTLRVTFANINSFNRKPYASFTRKSSWYFCFQKSTATLTWDVLQSSLIIHANPKLNHISTQRRFMSNSTTTPCDEVTKQIVVEGFSDEKINKAISLLRSDCGFRRTDDDDDDYDDVSDVLVNLDFFIQILEISPKQHTQLLDILGYVEWVCYRDDFKVTPSLLTWLVHIFSDPFLPRSLLHGLWYLVKRVGAADKGAVTTDDILDYLLLTCSCINDTETALEIFYKFDDFGCQPSFTSYYLTATSGPKHTILPWEFQFLHKIIDYGIFRKSTDRYILSYITHYCLRDKPKLAHAVYLAAKDRIPVKGVYHLIRSLSKHDDTVHLAMDMLAELSSEARNKATVVFSSVIMGLCRKGDINAAKTLLLEMIAKGPPPGVHAFTDIIKSLCQVADMEEALEVLKLMESRGLKPNVGTYRLMLNGYQKRGMMEQACTVVSMAKNKHPRDQYLTRLSSRLSISV